MKQRCNDCRDERLFRLSVGRASWREDCWITVAVSDVVAVPLLYLPKNYSTTTIKSPAGADGRGGTTTGREFMT